MKIILAGGHLEADFIINEFKKSNHQIIIINPDIDFAKYLSAHHDLPVFAGDPTKIYVLEDAQIHEADVFIALSENDTDNYIMSMTAKNLFGIKKVVCIVRNPNNVKVFKSLGVDRVINATNYLVQNIHNDAAIQQLSRTISLDDEDKIVVVEIQVQPTFSFLNQFIEDIHFPTNINISCVFRDPLPIIPKGDTMIKEGDKLLIVTTPVEKDKVVRFFEKNS